MQGMMEEMTDAGAKGADKVKQQLDELKLQLALGKMETRDKLDEQREKLSKAVSATKDGLDDLGDKASGKWQDATEAMNTQWKKLRPRLDALKLNMALGAAYAGDELDRRKEQLGTKLGEWKRKLQEEKEPVKNAVAEVGEDLKEAGADLVAGLKAFFKGDSEKDDDKEEDQTDTTESS